jgi:hypothetical protein
MGLVMLVQWKVVMHWGELGYFNARIIDYIIHAQTDNLAFTGIS